MSAQTDTDISDAIAALGKSLAAIGDRLVSQDERIAELKAERRTYLDSEVQRLIPDISNRSLQRLKEEMPEFVDAAVQSAFAANRKFLGLFAGPGYRQALLGLQTRLAHRLEGGRDSRMKETGRELTHLQADLDELSRLQSHTQGMYEQLQQMQITGAHLSDAAKEEIARIAQKAREMEEEEKENPQKKKRAPRQFADDGRSSNTSWDDDDSWIVFASDILTGWPDVNPGHVRAGGGSFDGAGASADFSNEGLSSSQDGNGSGMAAVAGALSAGIDSDATGSDIATDDSLGAFS